MELLELNLKHFGKFTGYRLELHAGINIISGGNETGKSTLHAFVRAMLYGITKNRSRSLDEYQLREPWENPSDFAGSMKVLYEGKIYRIDRTFHRRDESLSVVCETDGLEAPDPQAVLDLFTAGLSEADFLNTLFIRQAQAQSDAQLGERLRDFLVNMEQTGNSGLDVSAAQDFLKKKKKRTENGKQEELGRIEEEIRHKTQESEYLTRDLERLVERRLAGGQSESGETAFERVRSDPSGQMNAGEASASPASAAQTVRDTGYDEADDYDVEEEDGEDARGALLLTVLVLVSVVSAGLMAVCAFVTTDRRMTFVLAAGGVIFVIIAVALLRRLLSPETRSQRLRRKARREQFLDRHLGFRPDPTDLEEQEQIRRRQMERERKIRKAELEEVEQEDRRQRQMLVRSLVQQEREKETGDGGNAAGGVRPARDPGQMQYAQGVSQTRNRGLNHAQNQGSAQQPQNKAQASAQQAQNGVQVSAQQAQNEVQVSAQQARNEAQASEQQAQMLRARSEARSEVLDREIRIRREKLDTLREELEELYAKKASLSRYDIQIHAIELAQNRIRDLSGTIYRESGADFSENVSALLAGLTEGRYTSISLDEKMQIRINTKDRLLTVEQVSCGTMHQIYFALRLAAADLLTGGESLPVLLDEPFAMYDEERLESALRYLNSCSRQVILFSCQRRELDILARIRGK